MGCTSSRADTVDVPVEHAVGTTAHDVDAPMKAEKLVMRANALADEGELLHAVQLFAEAVNTYSACAPAYYGRARAYYRLGEFEKARSNFTCAIQYKPDCVEALSFRAAVSMDMEDYEAAVDDATAAIRMCPDDISAYKVRAAAYGALGDTARSFEDHEVAMALESRRQCVVCMEAPRATRLHPCMHAALCVACAKDLHAKSLPCPICSGAFHHVEHGTFITTWSPHHEESRGSAEGDSSNFLGTPVRHVRAGVAPGADSPLHLPPTPPLESRLSAVEESPESPESPEQMDQLQYPQSISLDYLSTAQRELTQVAVAAN